MLIITAVDVLLEVYWWLMVIRFILSWIPNVNYGHTLVQLVIRVTDPVVRPFQGIIPLYGSLDFSPLIVFLILRLIRPLLIGLLSQLLL
ncbi:MAG: YggT family protein [Firmicutes bacterium]|nr:YggT family protein [Bacillota bacterium]